MTRVAFLLFMICVVRGLWPGVNRFHALGLQPHAACLICLAYGWILLRELKTNDSLARSASDGLRYPVASAPG